MNISTSEIFNNIKVNPKKDRLCSILTKTRITLTIVMISFTIVGLVSVNEASVFIQYVKLHIDKTDFSLGTIV